ncbi:hypothetical protein NDA11_006746 [Ustilago hordei]|nr:hypothetical protein NDA10_005450 [Ustilago hordei]KAJ1583173.1 hypothetical protein NDA15_001144 [Ustilago hordei]KAJ1584773.1 hypothetical protein NDA11_006746 [Ustilago hordei]KAJ1591561.1 hypothetical protein NDA12_001049 [Ustilago hordei]KAJ1603237.1 hypothetical protein NDA14_004943 [Ustilago hordei]
MDVNLTPPDEMNGETIAILILFNFHCRVQLNDEAQTSRKKLLLFLMDKIYQTRPPSTSYSAYVDELRAAMEAEQDNCRIMIDYLDGMFHLLDVPDGLTKLFNEKLNRIMPTYEPTGMLNATDIFFERRSFFGLFFRRMKLVFDSLDLQARDHLTASARAWREGHLAASLDYDLNEMDVSPLSDARLTAFRDYQLGLFRGDYAMAKDNMERFFDFYAPGADRELHQHTLLHLAAFHLQTESFSAAKAALDEAISLARSANDGDCIAACESLMHRIQGVGTSVLASVPASSQAFSSGESRTTCNDAVWKVRCELARGRSAVEVLQNLENEFAPTQPSKEALAASEASLELMNDAKRRLGRDAVEQDAEVSHLWSLLGQPSLADVYQNRAHFDVDDHTLSASQEETRMDCICRKAKRLAQAGQYEEALTILVSTKAYHGIPVSQYTTWHNAIGDVLRLRAIRREDEAALRLLAENLPTRESAMDGCDIEDAVDTPSALVELALRYLESGRSSAAEKAFGEQLKAFSRLTAEEAAEALLRKAAQRAKSSEPTLSLMPTLASLSIAKEMDCHRLICSARVQLAETLGLHLKMPDGARLLMEADLPVCLISEDAELRSRAQWTYARILLSSTDKQNSEELTRVLRWMQEAEKDADRAECLGLQTQILYYMLRLHHHMGDLAEKTEVTARLDTVEKRWSRQVVAEDQAFLDQVQQILDIVVSVAGHVASGEAAYERLRAV